MQIRNAYQDEAEMLGAIAIQSKAHWGYSQEFIDACRQELTYAADDIRHGCFVVIEAEERVQGFYSLARISSTEVELDALFVRPEAIGKGFGRVLMEDAKGRAKSWGAQIMTIQADPNALQFYKAAGAEQIGNSESGSIPGRQLPLLAIALQ